MHFDKIINTAYSFGAAIVVFGAWSKLEHKAMGDTALTVGLLVETGIFCIYGLMEWRVQKPGQEEQTGQVQAVVQDKGGVGADGNRRQDGNRREADMGGGGPARSGNGRNRNEEIGCRQRGDEQGGRSRNEWRRIGKHAETD